MRRGNELAIFLGLSWLHVNASVGYYYHYTSAEADYLIVNVFGSIVTIPRKEAYANPNDAAYCTRTNNYALQTTRALHDRFYSRSTKPSRGEAHIGLSSVRVSLYKSSATGYLGVITVRCYKGSEASYGILPAHGFQC
jgi:hypothetical protein